MVHPWFYLGAFILLAAAAAGGVAIGFAVVHAF